MTYQARHTHISGGITVEVIDTMDALHAIRPTWERLEARDPEATLFLTWAWLAQGFAENPYRWSVLVARAPDPTQEAICILPLKYRTHWSRSREEFQTQMEAGGRLLFSEYTGFLCLPEFEEAGLRAVAGALAAMPWARLSMRYVAQARRSGIFTDALVAEGFDLRFRDYLINKSKTDNLLCPQVDLPESFDAYLADQVSANRRQKYRRLHRDAMESGRLHITHATPDTFDSHLDIFLSLWKARWAEQKGEDRAGQVARNYRRVLRAAGAIDAAFLPILWSGDQPLGALGHVVDRTNGVMHFIAGGRDPQAGEKGIGQLLHFHSIEAAIAQGLICYDFGHGNETYKYSYGAVDQPVLYFELRRPDAAPEMTFDLLCLGDALRRTQDLLARGKTKQAEKACAKLAAIFS